MRDATVYCQCNELTGLTTTTIDRRATLNVGRDFRAIQRSAINAAKLVPRPLRSASVDRHADGWSGTSSSAKYQQAMSGGGGGAVRYSGSSVYRDVAVTRLRATPPPPRDGVGREITDQQVPVVTPAPAAAAAAHVDSDVSSDLDQDIVDDLHLAETAPPRRTSADAPPTVVLRRSSAQDSEGCRGGVGAAARTQRSGSYHGSVHHSVTVSDFTSVLPNNPRTGLTNRSLRCCVKRFLFLNILKQCLALHIF